VSLLPRSAREKADASRYLIHRFLDQAAKEIPVGALILDAGAGNGRYRPLFERQRYIAADFCRVEGKNYGRIDVVTDLAEPGLKDGSLDAVVSTQVLEHIREPGQFLAQLARLLKPGGSLYLTCPLNWGVHEAPYDFYRYTRYALEDLVQSAGLELRSIVPMGGYFCLLGKILSRLPYQLDEPRRGIFRRWIFKTCFILLKEVFHYWMPYLLVHLDFLDKKKDFTLGYLCHATRPAGPAWGEPARACQ